MWIGSEHNNPKLKEKIEEHLGNAFYEEDESSYAWNWTDFESPREAEMFLEKAPVAVLSLLNPNSDYPVDHPHWRELCDGIKHLEPKACILAIGESEPPSGDAAISWLDQGADGIFNIDSDPDSSFSLFRELLSLPLKTFRSRHVRVPARHKITIRLSSFAQALATETMNIGTGGLFIRSIPPNVAIGDQVEFTLLFTKTIGDNSASENTPELVKRMETLEEKSEIQINSSDLSGEGKVVWIRHHAQGDLPEGIGVEFVRLSEDSNKKLGDFIASRRVKAFIPKS